MKEKTITIQDRIIKDFRDKCVLPKHIGTPNIPEDTLIADINQLEQFLIQSIKEVEEETRKETLEELENKLYDNWHIVNGSWKDMYKFLQSITNKEIKK